MITPRILPCVLQPLLMPTLSTKGQIVIPADVRRRHGWKPGQKLDFVESGRDVVVRPAAPAPIDCEAVLVALERLREGVNYTGPPIPIEQLGIGGIDYYDVYPDGP